MRWLILILWFFLFWYYYQCQKNCCAETSPAPTKMKAVPPLKSSVKKLTPFRFLCNSADVQTEPRWKQYRDSLLAQLDEDEQLQIQGLYYDNEKFDGKNNLGIARAKNVLKLFDGLNANRVELFAKTKGDSCLQNELNNLIAFRFLKKTKKIVETSDMTTIYFEYNSVKRLNDSEVESYLDDVVDRLNKSLEKVKLIGHTDNDGSYPFNMELGENRATVIADYLIRKGINPNRIVVDSRGEREPIATNDTPEGMAKNRRTELIIFE